MPLWKIAGFCFAFLFISYPASALVSSDKMSTRILKSYDKNILVLNRGLEDGIFKGDHIKLTNEQGFIARGICLKAGMLLSHWKIYRVVRPHLVSKDTIYLLQSMNQSQIPEDFEKFREVDFTGRFQDFSDKDVSKIVELQQDRIAKYDLPTSIQQAMERQEKTSETERFITKNFDASLLKQDFTGLELSLFAAPISWESLNDQRNMHYGFHFFNHGKKYVFKISAEQRETKIVDRFSQTEVEKTHTRSEGFFKIRQIAPSWSYFTYALYEGEKQGSVSRSQSNFAPAGVYKHFISDEETNEIFNLGFAPLFDYREYDSPETGEAGDSSGARLGFHLLYETLLSSSVSFKTDLWWKPYLDLAAQNIDLEDTQTNARATLKRNFTKHFSIEYQLQYLKDITYRTDLGANPENTINMINFRLTTDL